MCHLLAPRRLVKLSCYLSTYKHWLGLAARRQQDCREGSACPEPQLSTQSPSLEKARPPAPTPASQQSSPSEGVSGGPPLADSAGTVADDVFSTADEAPPAPESPHKEFYSAVVRALSMDSSVVKAGEAGQMNRSLA